MAAAGDMITLVLGLEIMSLAVYVLAAWRQNARESEEAGMKYFLLGCVCFSILNLRYCHALWCYRAFYL